MSLLIFISIIFIVAFIVLFQIFNTIFSPKTSCTCTGKNIKCGGDMIINGRRIPKRKDLDVQDVCVRDGKFVITYTDGSKLVGDDDPSHDVYTTK